MFTLNCRGSLWVVENPLIMGIINVTPDSFFEGSRFTRQDELLKQAQKMLSEGADILDIGGQSTRPGAERIGISEELDRVAEAVRIIHEHFPAARISIDTFYAKVAAAAVGAGAVIINDISAGELDEEMVATAASLNTPFVCMHMRGEPATMQKNPVYHHLVQELLDYFVARTCEIRKAGVKDIIIDPGFGFGKTIEDNFRILNKLELFQILDLPLMVGLSRKSTVYKTLGIDASAALNGTTVLQTVALLKGANILRVHDVREARETIMLLSKIHESQV